MADRPTHLAIKDWQKHQHYKDARPAWIKLYGALLDDPSFLALPEVAQAQLVKLWLLASRMGHPLPSDARLLAGKIGCRGKLHLDAILSSGFLVPVYERSRESLGDSSGTKTETERETDSSPSWVPAMEVRLAERLTTDAGRTALTAVLHVSDNKAGVVSVLESMLDGMHEKPVPPAVMDRALVEYAANGMSSGRFRAKHFRAFCREDQPPPPPKPRGGVAQRTYDNAIAALEGQ